MQKNETLNIVFYIIIFILIVGGVYYLMNRSESSPVPQQQNSDMTQEENNNTIESDLPEGVEIVERDGERVLRDERYGYEVAMNSDKVIYVDENTITLSESDSNMEGGMNGIEIKVYNESVDNQEIWLDRWIKNSNCSECYPNTQFIRGNVYKIVDEGALGDIINFFLFEKGKVYMFTVFDTNMTIEDILTKVNI